MFLSIGLTVAADITTGLAKIDYFFYNIKIVIDHCGQQGS